MLMTEAATVTWVAVAPETVPVGHALAPLALVVVLDGAPPPLGGAGATVPPIVRLAARFDEEQPAAIRTAAITAVVGRAE